MLLCLWRGATAVYGLAGSVDIGGGQVSEEDVARVLSSCDVPDFGEAREVLHAQPVNFALDNRSVCRIRAVRSGKNCRSICIC